MSSLKQLSANQLNKMLDETKELERRENILKRADIQAVLKKYNITIHTWTRRQQQETGWQENRDDNKLR